MWEVSMVFHEKQEGRLCAQHCLNATLQGSYFTAVDLSELALRLDEEERQQMSESGIESEDYKKFLQQPSGNMDDTGFFSVQVISQALVLWGLDLIPLNSTDAYATEIRETPTKAQAFIFNMESHWFCIRRFRTQSDDSAKIQSNDSNESTNAVFFNLNSLLSRPEYMSSLYLTEYLKQMQNEGYSIFVVSGEFPECPADLNPPKPLALNKTAKLSGRPIAFIDLAKSDSKRSVGENDEEIQRAIQMSLADWSSEGSSLSSMETNRSNIASTSASSNADSDLDAALKMSMECFRGSGKELSSERRSAEVLTPNQLRDKRLSYFNSMSTRKK